MGRLAISPFSVWVDRMAMSMSAISFAISASDFLDMFFLRGNEHLGAFFCFPADRTGLMLAFPFVWICQRSCCSSPDFAVLRMSSVWPLRFHGRSTLHQHSL